LQEYCSGKTDFLVRVLQSRSDQFSPEELRQITEANR